jgi:hypothetical protein
LHPSAVSCVHLDSCYTVELEEFVVFVVFVVRFYSFDSYCSFFFMIIIIVIIVTIPLYTHYTHSVLRSGVIKIPPMEVVPTAVVANGDMPPELEIRFDMPDHQCRAMGMKMGNTDSPLAKLQKLPFNWQLRFVHNQLFQHFHFPSMFCPGAFHSTIVRKAEFYNLDTQKAYFAQCDHVCQTWMEAGPKALNPCHISNDIDMIETDTDIMEDNDVNVTDAASSSSSSKDSADRSGLWLFTDRNTITHHFKPNFFLLSSHNETETESETTLVQTCQYKYILGVISEVWDESTLEFQPDARFFVAAPGDTADTTDADAADEVHIQNTPEASILAKQHHEEEKKEEQVEHVEQVDADVDEDDDDEDEHAHEQMRMHITHLKQTSQTARIEREIDLLAVQVQCAEAAACLLKEKEHKLMLQRQHSESMIRMVEVVMDATAQAVAEAEAMMILEAESQITETDVETENESQIDVEIDITESQIDVEIDITESHIEIEIDSPIEIEIEIDSPIEIEIDTDIESQSQAEEEDSILEDAAELELEPQVVEQEQEQEQEEHAEEQEEEEMLLEHIAIDIAGTLSIMDMPSLMDQDHSHSASEDSDDEEKEGEDADEGIDTMAEEIRKTEAEIEQMRLEDQERRSSAEREDVRLAAEEARLSMTYGADFIGEEDEEPYLRMAMAQLNIDGAICDASPSSHDEEEEDEPASTKAPVIVDQEKEQVEAPLAVTAAAEEQEQAQEQQQREDVEEYNINNMNKNKLDGERSGSFRMFSESLKLRDAEQVRMAEGFQRAIEFQKEEVLLKKCEALKIETAHKEEVRLVLAREAHIAMQRNIVACMAAQEARLVNIVTCAQNEVEPMAEVARRPRVTKSFFEHVECQKHTLQQLESMNMAQAARKLYGIHEPEHNTNNDDPYKNSSVMNQRRARLLANTNKGKGNRAKKTVTIKEPRGKQQSLEQPKKKVKVEAIIFEEEEESGEGRQEGESGSGIVTAKVNVDVTTTMIKAHAHAPSSPTSTLTNLQQTRTQTQMIELLDIKYDNTFLDKLTAVLADAPARAGSNSNRNRPTSSSSVIVGRLEPVREQEELMDIQFRVEEHHEREEHNTSKSSSSVLDTLTDTLVDTSCA